MSTKTTTGRKASKESAPAANTSKQGASGKRRLSRGPRKVSSISEAPSVPVPLSSHEQPVYEIRQARALDGEEADSRLFDAARSQWLTADWDTLAGWHVAEFAHHPKRARIALLLASALHELGDYDGSKEALHQAVEWGAHRRDLINVIIGQAHAAFGRARVAAKEFGRAEKHFLACITSIAPNRSAAHYAKDRVFKEAVGLGFLPDARNLLEQDLAEMGLRGATNPAQISVFSTKLEMLQHELSIALQRKQVGMPPRRQSAEAVTDKGSHATRLKDLQTLSTAQLGQDLWVLERSGFKTGGYFVEFGATDGVRLNNTHLLEKKFGWTGLCAEPNPTFLEKLKRNRSCLVSADCIAGDSGRQVEFLLADEFGGITEYCHDMHDDKRQAYRDLGQTLLVSTVSLHEFLRKHNAPRTIDYLSIDTEGSEYEILKNFPFDEWEVRLITVEHNFTPIRQSIRELLTSKGYVCQEAQWDDWYELAPPENRV
jgi:FkbM family methyltransferase